MKTAETIYQEMLDAFARDSGMTPDEGCDLAVRLRAVAAQLEGLYTQAQWVTRQCFPQTAQGTHLDYHAAMRALTRKQASRAEGTLRFLVAYPGETDRVIPAGTVSMTATLQRFETTEQATLPAGAMYVDVPARAAAAGVQGNVPAGAVVALGAIPPGVSGCTNPEGFVNGTDSESDESLRARVLESYQRLPNGANAAFYEQGALSFDQVQAVSVLPRARGMGTVDVVIATQDGLPSEELLSRVQEYFRQRREIAVSVQVRAPGTQSVAVQVDIQAAAGASPDAVRAAVQARIGEWFNGELLGRSVLRAQLGKLVFDCEGVENYRIVKPAADLTVAADTLPVLGTLSVGEL